MLQNSSLESVEIFKIVPQEQSSERTSDQFNWWLPLRRELEKDMPISSSDDTQVEAQVRLGKLVRYRAKVTV